MNNFVFRMYTVIFNISFYIWLILGTLFYIWLYRFALLFLSTPVSPATPIEIFVVLLPYLVITSLFIISKKKFNKIQETKVIKAKELIFTIIPILLAGGIFIWIINIIN